MEKPTSEPIGYAIEWKIEPPLWHDFDVIEGEEREVRTRGFSEEGIELKIEEGKLIIAETKNNYSDRNEFTEKASLIVERFVNAYVLLKGKFFEIVGLTHKHKKPESVFPTVKEIKEGKVNIIKSYEDFPEADLSTWFEIVGTTRGTEWVDFELSLDMLKLCQYDKTLERILRYNRLVFAGENVTSNLYKVIDALERRFGKSRKIRTKEARSCASSELGVSVDDFNYIGKLTSASVKDERHAPHPDEEANPPTCDEISEAKMRVKRIILAYVEWLRENRPNYPSLDGRG